MTTPHKASADQWASVRRRAEISGISDCCVIVELAARVEALEAAQPKQITQEELAKLLAQPAPVVPLATASVSSLVELPATFDKDENDRRFEQAKAIIDKPAPAPADAGESEYTDAEWGEIQRWNKTDDTSPAPASSLVERLEAAGYGRTHARAAIREVGEWLEGRRGAYACYYGGLLREEADR